MATAFWAASSRSAALMMGRPESARICFASSTLVPSRRTTKGREKLSPSSLHAATIPLATVAQCDDAAEDVDEDVP